MSDLDREVRVMEYRKKPVVIDAVQWTGHNFDELEEFTEGDFYQKEVDIGTSHATVKTLEGEHIALCGDFIIKGVAGEHYPCKPDIFEQTYEPATQKYIRADKAMPLCVERIMECGDLDVSIRTKDNPIIKWKKATTAEVLALLNSKEGET